MKIRPPQCNYSNKYLQKQGLKNPDTSTRRIVITKQQTMDLVMEAYQRGKVETMEIIVDTLMTFSRIADETDNPQAGVIYGELAEVFSNMKIVNHE